MAMVASELSWWVDRIVTDQTALLDKYDLDLEWAPDRPSILTAVREQLGLSLEPERGEVDVLVIERAERPTAN
jgi:uncharacterized protein (TIGR03435 family)